MNDPMRGTRSRGFSLLEVILALAILTGSIAMLGQAVQMGMRNARVARDSTKAQLLCESKMSEVVSGFTPAVPISDAAFDSVNTGSETAANDTGQWTYSIETESLSDDGLIAVTVSVTQTTPAPNQRPVGFKLVRWMIDPTTMVSADEELSDESSDTGDADE